MAKKKEETQEQKEKRLSKNLNRELEDLRNKLKFYSEPTYYFQIGESVSIGNLKDVTVEEVLDEGKIYKIDFTSINTNYGNPIITNNCKRYVSWVNVRKIPMSTESFITNEDISLNYSQRNIDDLLSKTYYFGVNFEPEYQREFVWSKEDKIKLIESIFNNVEIGKFVFIHYDNKKWSETGYSYEILDGKQRMRAILDFYEDRFQYKGKCYSELSYRDQCHFDDFPISMAEVSELSREQILRYFIMLNTGGRVMAKEHLNKVRKMLGE